MYECEIPPSSFQVAYCQPPPPHTHTQSSPPNILSKMKPWMCMMAIKLLPYVQHRHLCLSHIHVSSPLSHLGQLNEL